jgi:AcrR family transcriptional regulator
MPRVIPDYKEAAKNRIIQAAIRVFSKKGYQDTSMDEIAKEVGVTKATLYLYFESKKDLLKKISTLASQTLRENLQRSFKNQDFMEAFEEIYKMKRDMLKRFLHTSFEMMALSSNDESIRKIISDERKKDIEAVQVHLQNQMDKGIIRKDVDAYVLANLILALYWEMTTQLVAGFDQAKVHETWDKALAVILGKQRS